MEVRDGNEQNLNLRWFVNNAERKTSHLTTPDVATERMPCLWEFPDSLNCLPRFVPELVTQA